MSVNELFNKANKLFLKQDYFEGLKIYEQIWIKYPKNIRLHEEINKKIKRYNKPISQTYSENDVKHFFKLEQTGQVSKVIQILTENLTKNPKDLFTISLLGSFYNLIKDYKKAIFFQKTAIQKSPLERAFYLNLSETLQNKGELEESVKILYLAKILSLKDITIDYKIAKLETKMKNFSRADLIYKNLIRQEKINKEMVYSYCDNLIKFKKEEEAISFIEYYEKTKETDDYLKLYIGLAFFNQKFFKKAIDYFLFALDINPNNTDALNMLGNAYERLGDITKAKHFYNDALKKNPNDKMTLNNLAALSFYKGEQVIAEKLYSEAIKKSDNNYEAIYLLGLCQLAQLKFIEGWKNYKFRWLGNQLGSKKLFTNLPQFALNTDKRNLLVWDEQGLGDKILFLRFLKGLEPYVDNLFIKIDKRLHELIKRIFPKINFINNKNLLESNINSQIPIADLGSLFIKDTYDLKNTSKKYITSDSFLTNELKNSLRNKNKLICGLSWISKNDNVGLSKSITLNLLKPILELNNILFLDIQYSDTQDERSKFFNDHGIRIHKIESVDNFNDINGVTSLVDLCDFIITISNTNAHIAGALGKKTFLLLPRGKGRFWYWNAYNEKSLWYPSIEIIEQNSPGQWKPVINKLLNKLKDYKSE